MSGRLQLRIEFSRYVAQLLTEANRLGRPWVIGEVIRHELVAEWNATHCAAVVAGKRCEGIRSTHTPNSGHPFIPIGARDSLHRRGLAVDLLVFNPDWSISNNPEHYRPLGAFWKNLDDRLRWGGDFKRIADLGHFSLGTEGMQ